MCQPWENQTTNTSHTSMHRNLPLLTTRQIHLFQSLEKSLLIFIPLTRQAFHAYKKTLCFFPIGCVETWWAKGATSQPGLWLQEIPQSAATRYTRLSVCLFLSVRCQLHMPIQEPYDYLLPGLLLWFWVCLILSVFNFGVCLWHAQTRTLHYVRPCPLLFLYIRMHTYKHGWYTRTRIHMYIHMHV